MPKYGSRCEGCGRRLLLHLRSVAARPACPHCDSGAVGVARATREHASMSSGEILSVLEGEDAQEVRELQRQLHGDVE